MQFSTGIYPYTVNASNLYNRIISIVSIYLGTLYKDSSQTQILNVNRPSNHPSTTKTRPQAKQARLPTKTAVALGSSY